MKCHFVTDDIAGKVLITECWQCVMSHDIEDCTCERKLKLDMEEKNKINDVLSGGLINLSELARRMWPNNKSAEQHLNQKIKGIAGRKLSDSDYNKINEILSDLKI